MQSNYEWGILNNMEELRRGLSQESQAALPGNVWVARG
jgi:hypothetical protein